MIDPLPDKNPLPDTAPGYNLPVYRRRRKRFSKLFAPPVGPEGFYSAFLPLLIVFCAFIILLLYEISFLRYRTLVLSKQNARLAEVVKKADAQAAFIEGLHKDLQTLAPAHPAAALMLTEFFPDIPPNAANGSSTPQK